MKTQRQPFVSVIVLNYNGKENTLKLLHSLQKTIYPNYEIIVVDNGSTDGSVEAIRKKDCSIVIVENTKNLGYSGGMNAGIRNSRGEHVVLLNNDMVVHHPNWLSELVKIANQDREIGVVGPMLLEYAMPEKIQQVGSVLSNWFLIGAWVPIGAGQKDCGQYSKPIEVTWTNGLIKRIVIERIGMLDEKMFAYWEEVDFCFRAKKAGFKIIVTPKSKIWHTGSATIKKRTFFVIYEFYKNRLRYILKNYGRLHKIVAIAFNLLYYLARILFFLVKGEGKRSIAVLDAIRWNIKKRKDYHI